MQRGQKMQKAQEPTAGSLTWGTGGWGCKKQSAEYGRVSVHAQKLWHMWPNPPEPCCCCLYCARTSYSAVLATGPEPRWKLATPSASQPAPEHTVLHTWRGLTLSAASFFSRLSHHMCWPQRHCSRHLSLHPYLKPHPRLIPHCDSAARGQQEETSDGWCVANPSEGNRAFWWCSVMPVPIQITQGTTY